MGRRLRQAADDFKELCSTFRASLDKHRLIAFRADFDSDLAVFSVRVFNMDYSAAVYRAQHYRIMPLAFF